MCARERAWPVNFLIWLSQHRVKVLLFNKIFIIGGKVFLPVDVARLHAAGSISFSLF